MRTVTYTNLKIKLGPILVSSTFSTSEKKQGLSASVPMVEWRSCGRNFWLKIDDFCKIFTIHDALYTYVFRKKVLQECLKKNVGPSYFENCLLSKK
jgi:hypothetical protein